MIFASFSLCYNVEPFKWNIVGFSFLLMRSYICEDEIVKNYIIFTSILPLRAILDIVNMSQSAIIFKFSFFFIFLQIVYDNMFVSARKSSCAVPFGSDTSLKSELGYQYLIRRVIDHYGQFQNGRRKIHVFFTKCIIEHGYLKFRITSTAWVCNLKFYCSFKYLQMLECDI